MSDDYITANVPGRWIMEKDAEILRLRDELAAVTAERDRMRDALRPFKQKSFDCGGRHILSREYVLVKWLLDARAALEGVTEPPPLKPRTPARVTQADSRKERGNAQVFNSINRP